MRTELLAYLTTATNTAAIKTVSELPWNTAGEPLYIKNMKKFYLDVEQITQSEYLQTLPGYDNFHQNAYSVKGYFAIDAKNSVTNFTSALSLILNAKNQLGVDNLLIESDYTTEIQDDVIIYTVEYRMTTTT